MISFKKLSICLKDPIESLLFNLLCFRLNSLFHFCANFFAQFHHKTFPWKLGATFWVILTKQRATVVFGWSFTSVLQPLFCVYKNFGLVLSTSSKHQTFLSKVFQFSVYSPVSFPAKLQQAFFYQSYSCCLPERSNGTLLGAFWPQFRSSILKCASFFLNFIQFNSWWKLGFPCWVVLT